MGRLVSRLSPMVQPTTRRLPRSSTRQVEPAFVGGHVGDVGGPHFVVVAPRLPAVAPNPVRRDGRSRHIDRSQPEVDADIKLCDRLVILILLETFRTRPVLVTINPSPEARDLLDRFYNEITDRKEGELSDITSYAARWNEQAWRISLCLHAAKWSTGAESCSLEAEVARNGIRIARWFVQQQLAILEQSWAVANREREEEVRLLLTDKPSGITLRNVHGRLRIQPAEAERLLNGMDLEAEQIGLPKGGHNYMFYKRKLR